MRKIVAAINMTIDGFFDHTLINPDEEIHEHYANLLNEADVILYGSITYQLMEFWQNVLTDLTADKSLQDFAVSIDKIQKVVFSRTLNKVDWKSAKLATNSLAEEVSILKLQPGKPIFVGSRSLIIQLLQLHLLDELQLCIHPVVAGGGRPLFEKIDLRNEFKLISTKTFNGGAVILYYKPI